MLQRYIPRMDVEHLHELVKGLASIFFSFIAIRIIHRFYFIFRGHSHYVYFRPRLEMENFILGSKIPFVEEQFKSKRDNTIIKYRKLGNGSKVVLLANGVGTDFFMWLPTLANMLQQYPSLFREITLIAPSYRGLFGSNKENSGDEVDISIANIVEDIQEIMQHCSVLRFHAIIGWSLGAQTAITCCSTYPATAERLFLLNPSCGLTLHGAFQPIIPLPKYLGDRLSSILKTALKLVRPLTFNESLWNRMRTIAFSTLLRIVLEMSSFCGGFPPEQVLHCQR